MLTRRGVAILVGLFASAGAAKAQTPGWDPLSRHATRESLEALLQRMERAAASPAYSPVLRSLAAEEAARIQRRLTTGDFVTGDRILLVVEGEEMLTDTFSVSPGPELVIPTVGTIPLAGVLRTELASHLTEQVSRFVRNPTVRAKTLVRISIDGGVERPGFYMLSTDVIITDALQSASGLGREAKLDEVVIERNNEVLWDRAAVAKAITDGRTLDELGVQAGDRIAVGTRGEGIGSFYTTFRTIGLILALPAAVLGLIGLFSR